MSKNIERGNGNACIILMSKIGLFIYLVMQNYTIRRKGLFESIIFISPLSKKNTQNTHYTILGLA